MIDEREREEHDRNEPWGQRNYGTIENSSRNLASTEPINKSAKSHIRRKYVNQETKSDRKCLLLKIKTDAKVLKHRMQICFVYDYD